MTAIAPRLATTDQRYPPRRPPHGPVLLGLLPTTAHKPLAVPYILTGLRLGLASTLAVSGGSSASMSRVSWSARCACACCVS